MFDKTYMFLTAIFGLSLLFVSPISAEEKFEEPASPTSIYEESMTENPTKGAPSDELLAKKRHCPKRHRHHSL